MKSKKSKKRIKPTKIIKSTTSIHTRIVNADDETVRFSFKHIDLANDKFSFEGKNCEYFSKVIERLKNISSFKISEIFSDRSSSLRAHPIDWQETTEKDGFANLNDQLKQIQAYQFQISSNQYGRLHGFILRNIFFIVWFDPEHNLYAKNQ